MKANKIVRLFNNRDADAQAFIDAVGTLSSNEQIAISNLVKGLKTNGTWSKYKAIYPIIGGTAASHKWNLKDPRDLDAAFRITYIDGGNFTHLVTGIRGNSTSTYLNSNLNLTTLPGFSVGSLSLGFYARDKEAGAIPNVDMGIRLGSTGIALWMGYQSINEGGFDSYGAGGANGYSSVVTNMGTLGRFQVGSRTSTTLEKLFVNGNEVGTPNTNDISASSAPNGAIHMAGWIWQNTLYDSTASEYCWFHIAEGFTNTEVANDYTVIQAYQVALGRQV